MNSGSVFAGIKRRNIPIKPTASLAQDRDFFFRTVKIILFIAPLLLQSGQALPQILNLSANKLQDSSCRESVVRAFAFSDSLANRLSFSGATFNSTER